MLVVGVYQRPLSDVHPLIFNGRPCNRNRLTSADEVLQNLNPMFTTEIGVETFPVNSKSTVCLPIRHNRTKVKGLFNFGCSSSANNDVKNKFSTEKM